MKLPAVTDFADGAAFMAAMNAWQAASGAAYAQLRELYDATPASTERPDWTRDGKHLAHVDTLETPRDIEPCLRNLAGHALQRGFKIVRVAHGTWSELRGKPVWCCFVELQKA